MPERSSGAGVDVDVAVSGDGCCDGLLVGRRRLPPREVAPRGLPQGVVGEVRVGLLEAVHGAGQVPQGARDVPDAPQTPGVLTQLTVLPNARHACSTKHPLLATQ